jgi:membrane protein YdbS with pleckstrin-like domain/GT2 family glycosyltransferase
VLTAALTVVVPAHGHPDRVRALLAELDRQADPDRPLRVVVVDDASARPLTLDLEPRDFSSLALAIERREVNGGPGASRNRGLELVETPWVAFFDSDEIPGPGWLARMEAIAASESAPDGVEGRITTGSERATPFTHIAEATLPGAQHVAGNIAFRADVLRRLGGFDERFYDSGLRLHFREDTELFFRVDDAGLNVPFDPDLLAHHPPLPASYSSPLRDARRYYFDPLLAREHGDRFRTFNRLRRVGPVPLRRARHVAAVGHVAAVVVAATAALTGRRTAAGGAAGVAVAVVAALLAIASVAVVPRVRLRRFRYEVREDEIDLRHGIVVQVRTLVPMVRVQHVDTRRTVLSQMFGLAAVVFHTAAGANEIPALREADAAAIRDRIADLARTPEVL